MFKRNEPNSQNSPSETKNKPYSYAEINAQIEKEQRELTAARQVNIIRSRINTLVDEQVKTSVLLGNVIREIYEKYEPAVLKLEERIVLLEKEIESLRAQNSEYINVYNSKLAEAQKRNIPTDAIDARFTPRIKYYELKITLYQEEINEYRQNIDSLNKLIASRKRIYEDLENEHEDLRIQIDENKLNLLKNFNTEYFYSQ
jgi:hypothetical protein